MAYDEDLADRTRDAVVDLLGEDLTVAALTERKMFGGLAFLVHGNMAIGVSGQGGLMVRVDPVDTEDLLAEPGAAPW
jgi:TfoX/Sxy family transcriptional regulator of competence genes